MTASGGFVRSAVASSIVALGGTPANALTDDEKRGVLLSIIASKHGCVFVKSRGAWDDLSIEGLHFDDSMSTLIEMINADDAKEVGREIMLSSSICPPEQITLSPRQRVLATFQENDCSMSDAAVVEAHPELDSEFIGLMIYRLRSAGQMTRDESLSLVLDDQICRAN